ncbi:MAG: hypothetical protein MHM6MM_000809 [Cercozoa sp. M6MM]
MQALRRSRQVLAGVRQFSWIGAQPIPVPDTVKLSSTPKGDEWTIVQVDGPLGSMRTKIHGSMQLEQEDGVARIVPNEEHELYHPQFWGYARTVVSNGVRDTQLGFTVNLKIEGLGYRGECDGEQLKLKIGFCEMQVVEIPNCLLVEMPDPTTICISGVDRYAVTSFASTVRKLRKPEPYKGKGVRYEGEVVKLKPGKRK